MSAAVGRWLATGRREAADTRPFLARAVALAVGGSLLLACAPSAGRTSPSSTGSLISPTAGQVSDSSTCPVAAFLCRAGGSPRPVVAEPWKGIIKVAVVAPYSGPATALGLSLLAGARAAADDLNRTGGAGGYRILILAPDERNAATPGDLVEDPAVVAVIGHLLPTGESTVDLYRHAGLVWLATQPTAGGVARQLLVPSAAVLQGTVAGYLRQEAGWSDGDARALADRCLGAAGEGGVIHRDRVWLLCQGKPEDLASSFGETPPGARLLCIPLWCASPELTAWSGGISYDYLDLVTESRDLAPDGRPPGGEQRVGPVSHFATLGYRGIELVARAVARSANRGEVSRRSVAAALRDRSPSDRALDQGVQLVVRRSQGQYPGQIIFRPRGLPS